MHGSLPLGFRHEFHIYLSRISAHKWLEMPAKQAYFETSRVHKRVIHELPVLDLQEKPDRQQVV
jgi:hypothetical protein